MLSYITVTPALPPSSLGQHTWSSSSFNFFMHKLWIILGVLIVITAKGAPALNFYWFWVMSLRCSTTAFPFDLRGFDHSGRYWDC